MTYLLPSTICCLLVFAQPTEAPFLASETPSQWSLITQSSIIVGQADPKESVEAGREALNNWYASYPWYDAETDSLQRVDVSESWSWDWLGDWIDSWNFNWNWNLNFSWPTTLLQWIFWIVFAALMFLLLYVLIRVRRRWKDNQLSSTADSAEKKEADDRHRIEALSFPVRAAQTDLLAQAKHHYLQGNYSEAIKYLFSYELVQLDKSHFIQLTRGKTNRQYLREVGRSTIKELLEPTMVAFEDVFFGNHPLEKMRFEWCWSQLPQFDALIAGGNS